MPTQDPRFHTPPRRGPGAASAAAATALALTLGAGAMTYLFSRAQSARVPHYPDDAPERSARGSGWREDHYLTGRTVLVNKPRSELYAFWRDAANLARFMENIEKVEVTGPKSARWTIKAPAGQTVTLDTEITEERENELICWRSTPDSQIEAHGHVRFRDAAPGRGTYVEAETAYRPPGGEIGRLAARLFARAPRQQTRRDLKRFKMLMEAGEIASSELHPEHA